MAPLSFVDSHVHFYDLQLQDVHYAGMQPGVTHPVFGSVAPIQALRHGIVVARSRVQGRRRPGRTRVPNVTERGWATPAAAYGGTGGGPSSILVRLSTLLMVHRTIQGGNEMTGKKHARRLLAIGMVLSLILAACAAEDTGDTDAALAEAAAAEAAADAAQAAAAAAEPRRAGQGRGRVGCGGSRGGRGRRCCGRSSARRSRGAGCGYR